MKSIELGPGNDEGKELWQLNRLSIRFGQIYNYLRSEFPDETIEKQGALFTPTFIRGNWVRLGVLSASHLPVSLHEFREGCILWVNPMEGATWDLVPPTYVYNWVVDEGGNAHHLPHPPFAEKPNGYAQDASQFLNGTFLQVEEKAAELIAEGLLPHEGYKL